MRTQAYSYRMRDLSDRKIEQIMAFDVKERRSRSRSVFEIGVFLVALAAYLGTLAISA